MQLLFAIPVAALAVILTLSIAPIFDFRRRPLSGSMGTCAFGQLPGPSPLPTHQVAIPSPAVCDAVGD
jgi:hypothetical protein